MCGWCQRLPQVEGHGCEVQSEAVVAGDQVLSEVSVEFVKIGAQTAATRLMGELGRLGHTEVRFYHQLGPELVGVPEAFGTAFDGPPMCSLTHASS